MGVVIPCLLTSFIGYSAHIFVLANFMSWKLQLWFQSSLTMLWISYALAIFTNPGRPAKSFKPLKKEWTHFCKKCQLFKPERAHHCKTCNQCVLMMDHHCPWTMNCVGFKNFPHFLRFLFWVVVTTGFLLYQLLKRTIYLWGVKDLPSYLFEKTEITFLIILIPMDGFVLITVALLFIRCLSNQIIGGKTQIESWELERLENLYYRKKLLPQLLVNLWEIYPNEKTPENKVLAKKLQERGRKVRFENIVTFPYDLDIWSNALTVLGSPVQWLWLFGGPDSDGMHFKKNELALYEEGAAIEDLLLSLPWPPDGGRNFIQQKGTNVESITENGEQVIRQRNFENDNSYRKTWNNDWGENLEDFGVDVDVE